MMLSAPLLYILITPLLSLTTTDILLRSEVKLKLSNNSKHTFYPLTFSSEEDWVDFTNS